MSNINNYLEWRGDVPLNTELPLNEIDSMILARFSYLIFDKIKMEDKETIKTISEKMKNFKNEEFLYNGDKELITNLGLSRRFRDMLVTDLIENNEKENEKQFRGITIHTSKDDLYISYIGTDATIYGWKEDFNMAFMENVPCQIEGKKYLEKIANKYPNKKIRIGGHSKGGNVAIYAAIKVDKEIQDRIIKVYNYDGPGFHKQFIDNHNQNAIINKINTYFPQGSIIGRIMNHEEKCLVALSVERGIYQHDIYSWQVMGTDLVYSAQLTNTSEVMNKTVTNWLENTTNEQRKIFFDTVFELFYSTEATTFGEMSKHLSKNLPIIYKRYGEISVEDKKVAMDMTKLFAKTYFKELFSRSEY